MLAETVEALDAGLAPEDAFQCFMCTDLDLLVLGNVILRKSEQDPHFEQRTGANLSPTDRRGSFTFTQAVANDLIQAGFWRILRGGSKEVKRSVRPCDYAGQVRFEDTGRKAAVGSVNAPDS